MILASVFEVFDCFPQSSRIVLHQAQCVVASHANQAANFPGLVVVIDVQAFSAMRRPRFTANGAAASLLFVEDTLPFRRDRESQAFPSAPTNTFPGPF
jgi:hypothetical protein